ncbi:MAG: hypothetical protein HYY17_00395 [Planctomycetes bacterium]|nr:hypothetical protein [Planctomycetota bacterium]
MRLHRWACVASTACGCAPWAVLAGAGGLAAFPSLFLVCILKLFLSAAAWTLDAPAGLRAAASIADASFPAYVTAVAVPQIFFFGTAFA